MSGRLAARSFVIALSRISSFDFDEDFHLHQRSFFPMTQDTFLFLQGRGAFEAAVFKAFGYRLWTESS